MSIDSIEKDKKIIILGHLNPDVDSLISGYLLEKLLIKHGYNAEFIVIDTIEKDETNNCLKYDFDPRKYIKKVELTDEYNYFLVDHNETYAKGKVVGVVDHHPYTKRNSSYFNVKNSSSTTCLIYHMDPKCFNEYDLNLVILGAFVDTASFHSSKACLKDKIMVKRLCKNYNFDYKRFYNDGLCLTDIKDANCFLNGLKNYDVLGNSVNASYMQVNNLFIRRDNINKLIFNIKDYLKKNTDVNSFVLIIYDMDKFNTHVYFINSTDVLFKKYKDYISRGQIIMPYIKKYFNELSKKMSNYVEI